MGILNYAREWASWWTFNWKHDRALVVFRLALASTFIQLGLWAGIDPPRAAGQVQGAWVQVGLMALSVGLSLIAGKMLSKKNKSPIQDDKPTTLTTRGAFCPWFMGIRQVAPVFCWAGEREIRKEKQKGGGKGGPSLPDAEIFFESGWHVLGVGPVYSLRSIDQGGKVIFNGPITSESHPSGTTVDLGAEGSFAIYWGESSQPINTFLGDSERVSVSSRWPSICYVVWNKKRLSTSPTWPILRYVLERRPSNTLLSQSSGYYEANQTLTGVTFDVFAANSSAVETVGYLEFLGDQTAYFKPTTIIQLVGNGLPDGDYEVLLSEVELVVTGVTPNGYDITSPRTRVRLQGGTLGADSNGTAETYEPDQTDGANIAHVIAELLFADFPQGLQIDPEHPVEKWDVSESLEALGVEAETEGWRASVLGTEGETCEALLGVMLQDHGVFLPFDVISGKLTFKAVRYPVGSLPNIPSQLNAESLPEIESMHGEMAVDRIIFAFVDRAHDFSEMTITEDDDGQAGYLEHQRARQVPIGSTVLFETAAALSELRQGEELAQSAEYRLSTSREARELLPGDAITHDDFDEVLRVTKVGIDPSSEIVQLSVFPDFYGAPKSTFITNPGGGQITVLNPEPDSQFIWLEVPEQALGGFPIEMAALALHIRANAQVSFASLWISRDDTTYTLDSNDTLFQTGGTLTAALPADGPSYVAQGPEYTELGPDNSSLSQDLSADLTNWGLGRQLAVISSTAGVEICFLQKATITGVDTRRLDGLLRARYDTLKLEHPIGAQVYIFDIDVVSFIQDSLLEPEEDFYLKTQPGTSGGQVNLSAVPPYGELLYGKGQRPVKPSYVYVRAPFKNSPSFQTGDDITISWAVSTGPIGTGAGFQSAGTPIAAPEIPGVVTIELLTAANALVSTIGVDASVAEYEIANADLVLAFTSEPSSFKVRVTHTANGRSSAVSDTITITRV